jgi:hypothetical protein
MAITLDGTSGITTPGLTNTGTETIVNLTTTGNTILGDASTDTLNVGNGGLVKDASGNVGIGIASPYTKLDVNGVITVEPIASGGKPQILLGSGGASYGQIQNDANGLWSLGYGGTSTALGTPVLKWDASGNLGLGVTPSAWVTYKAIEIGVIGSSLWSSASIGDIRVSGNMYYSGGYKYAGSNLASMYQQASGIHSWYNAPSGTAGNAITFTQAMTLDASGNLGIGTTSPGSKLDIRATSPTGATTNQVSIMGTETSGAAGTGGGIQFGGNDGSALGRVWGAVQGLKENSTVGDVASYLSFSTRAAGAGALEKMRIDSAGNFLLGATSTSSNGKFTNAGNSAALASSSNVRVWTQVYNTAASNNATVDAWIGRDAAGNSIGNGFTVGHFYVYVTGASGVNAFSGIYSLVTTGNGTPQATLTAVSTVIRGTSPVSSIQIANDGAGGAIKLTITYINNGVVVTGGYSKVTFIGQLA